MRKFEQKAEKLYIKQDTLEFIQKRFESKVREEEFTDEAVAYCDIDEELLDESGLEFDSSF